MTRTVISIDAMGGDRGPDTVVSGLERALAEQPDLHFIVHGDKSRLDGLLAKRSSLAEACEVRHAEETVSMSAKPSRVVRDGQATSMWHTLDTVKAGEATVAVSSGNTGALMAVAMRLLRRAPGVNRPAIAVQWPADNPHGFNTVLDMGADIRADSRNLLQFAVMGAEYARLNFGLEEPRVGILNVGSEETKGPDELREALKLCRAAAGDPELGFRVVGFVEGHDVTSGAVDVIVTDGFTGNVALKAGEGTAGFVQAQLKNAFTHSIWTKLATVFAEKSLKRLMKRIDPRRANGGVFLGLNGGVVKSHGGADATGFAAAVALAAKMAATDFSAHVADQLGRLAADGADAGDRRASAEGSA